MSAGRRGGLAALLLAGLLAGCGVSSVEVQNGGVPLQPATDDIAGVATVVAEGNSEAGAYRAWVYTTTDGSLCFELATAGVASSSCGSGQDAVLGIQPLNTETGWLVAGGTRQPASVAVLHTFDGAEHRAPVKPAPGGVTPGVRYLVIGGTGAAPQSLDLLDGAGRVIETIDMS